MRAITSGPSKTGTRASPESRLRSGVVRIGRFFVLTSMLALAAACVSTSGFDNPPPEPTPDASIDSATDTTVTQDASVDENAPIEDADATFDVLSVDGGGKLADFREDFSQPLDPSLWYLYFVSPFSFSQASAQLHLFCPSKVTNKLAYLKTLRWFDANSSSVHVNLVTAGAAGIASETNQSLFWLKIADAKSSNAVEIGVSNGRLYAKHFVNSSVGVDLQSSPYSAASMVWLRMRMAQAAVVWEYAALDTGPWSPLFTEPPQMSFDTVTLEMGIGGFPGTPGEVIVDNLNGP